MQSTQGMEQTTTAPAMEGVEPSDQQEQDGSPHKRGRVQDQPLTLALLKEVLAQERHADREHLAQSPEQSSPCRRVMPESSPESSPLSSPRAVIAASSPLYPHRYPHPVVAASSPRHRIVASFLRYRPTLSAAVSPAILTSLLASSSPRSRAASSPVLTHSPHPLFILLTRMRKRLQRGIREGTRLVCEGRRTHARGRHLQRGWAVVAASPRRGRVILAVSSSHHRRHVVVAASSPRRRRVVVVASASPPARFRRRGPSSPRLVLSPHPLGQESQ